MSDHDDDELTIPKLTRRTPSEIIVDKKDKVVEKIDRRKQPKSQAQKDAFKKTMQARKDAIQKRKEEKEEELLLKIMERKKDKALEDDEKDVAIEKPTNKPVQKAKTMPAAKAKAKRKVEIYITDSSSSDDSEEEYCKPRRVIRQQPKEEEINYKTYFI